MIEIDISIILIIIFRNTDKLKYLSNPYNR